MDVTFLKLYMSKKNNRLIVFRGWAAVIHQASLTQYGNAIPDTAGASNNAKQRFSQTKR